MQKELTARFLIKSILDDNGDIICTGELVQDILVTDPQTGGIVLYHELDKSRQYIATEFDGLTIFTSKDWKEERTEECSLPFVLTNAEQNFLAQCILDAARDGFFLNTQSVDGACKLLEKLGMGADWAGWLRNQWPEEVEPC